jgi:hypothetical protein
VVCAGCSQIFGLDKPVLRPDAGIADGPRNDTFGDVGPDGYCYGSSLVRVCFASPPSGTVVPNSADLDTDGSSDCAVTTNATSWCVLAGGDVNIMHNIVVHGSRPLVVVATGSITVATTLDVASQRGSTTGPGAGADAPGCNASGSIPLGGGGPGGSFGGTGGPGSGGQFVAGGPLPVTALRGGCPGEDGGGSTGSGGRGGGAVYLIAGMQITVAGAINASGEGGAGGSVANDGGGGGGSGGFIGLESQYVQVSGMVFANGGGGGEGGQNNTGRAGSDPSSPNNAAAGGNGGTSAGGAGGVGSFSSTLDGGAGQIGGGNAGSGGGGGGAGVVWLRTAISSGGGQVAPPAQ